MESAVDSDVGNGSTGNGAEKHAADRVTKGDTVASLKGSGSVINL